MATIKKMLSVRPATNRDLEYIRELIYYLMKTEKVEGIQKHTDIIINERIKPTFKKNSINKTFVSTYNGRPVGFILVEIRRATVASLAYISVHPDFQKRGIGRTLIKQAGEYARSIGINILEAIAHKDNKHSKRFHEKNGFSLFGYVLRKKP